MSFPAKTLLLSAGLALLVLGLGVLAFGMFFSGTKSDLAETRESDSGRYTAALKIVPGGGGGDDQLGSSKLLPTPTPVNSPDNPVPPPPPPSPTPTPTPPSPVRTPTPDDTFELAKGNACKFTSGPRAGQIGGLSPSSPVLLGAPCEDGSGSAGTVVRLSEDNGSRDRMGNACKFISGPRAGQIEDRSQLPRQPFGSPCRDGRGSLGKVVQIFSRERSPALENTPEATPTPAPVVRESVQPGGTQDSSPRPAPAVKPTSPPPPSTVSTAGEKDNVDMCYPASMYTGEGKNVILRLIRAPEPTIDDFCPSTVNSKKEVKRSLPLSTDASVSKTDKLLKDFCQVKGESYEPQVFATLNSSSFKVDTDESRQVQSLLEPQQEWYFNIKPDGDALGEQEVSFSLRVDCVSKRDKADVLHFPLPSSPAFKIEVQKRPSPLVEFGTINIAGLISGLIGSVLCFPFLSDRFKVWRQKLAARRERNLKNRRK